MFSVSGDPPGSHDETDSPPTKRRPRADAVGRSGPRPDAAPWFIRVDYIASLKAFGDCSDAVFRLAYHLDGIARFNPFVWADNEALARLMGLQPRGFAKVLAKSRDEGCIEPVHDGGPANHRLGIILVRRLSPLAVADNPSRLDVVRRHVSARWRPMPGLDVSAYWASQLDMDTPTPAQKGKAPAQKGMAPRPSGQSEPRPKVRQNKDSPCRKDSMNNDPGEVSSRHDQIADSAPLPDDVIRFEPPALLPVQEVLNPLLGRLPPEQLVAYGRADSETQARVLILLARGDLPARKSVGRLLERFALAGPDPLTFPIAPPPPAQPLSFEELVGAIAATRDPLLVKSFADRCAAHFGTVRDQRLFAQFRKVGEAIALGTYEPDAVVRVARAAFAPGVRVAGAYFWRSLKNTLTDADSKAV